jgi:hypothetical protein
MTTETSAFWSGIAGNVASAATNIWGQGLNPTANQKIAASTAEAVGGVVKVFGFVAVAIAIFSLIFKLFK